MPANEEQLRRARIWADRRLTRAHGPRTARTDWDDFDQIEANDEARQIRKGGNR